ncbi:hypothetical protein LguiA_030874 [Lonicera macranthoides]
MAVVESKRATTSIGYNNIFHFRSTRHGRTDPNSNKSNVDLIQLTFLQSQHDDIALPPVKHDVYGFGVVLLEILTGLQRLDDNRPHGMKNLLEYASPTFLTRQSNAETNNRSVVRKRLPTRREINNDSWRKWGKWFREN